MNPRQAAFYRQALSDWSVFQHLHPIGSGIVGPRPYGFALCHELHYLQMCTEKLAKAYYQTSPRTGHAAFRQFLRDVLLNPSAISPLGFATGAELTRWIGSVSSVVGAVEDLAPSIADRKSLPNPEYPWPRDAEVEAPVDVTFYAQVYERLENQSASGQPAFLTVLDRMVRTMQADGWNL